MRESEGLEEDKGVSSEPVKESPPQLQIPSSVAMHPSQPEPQPPPQQTLTPQHLHATPTPDPSSPAVEEEEQGEEEEHLAVEQPVGGSMAQEQQDPSGSGRETPDSPGALVMAFEDAEGHEAAKVDEPLDTLMEPDMKADLRGGVEGERDLDYDPQGESYPCEHCERHFSTKQGLERHSHIHSLERNAFSHTHTQAHSHTPSPQPDTPSFNCRYCGKSFGSQVGRRRHERRHESAVGKKRPGSLAGTAALLSPQLTSDADAVNSSPLHLVSPAAQNGGYTLSSPDRQRRELVGPGEFQRLAVEENGSEAREQHVCKYCNKAFGTHTNMRRHQRRIHERHLLPKGVRRKGTLLPEAVTTAATAQAGGGATGTASRGGSSRGEGSPGSHSPPRVYMPSVESEDEVGADEVALADISSNISENLSLYLDGKIACSNASTPGAGCEVIEVNAGSAAALFGLDTLIISPEQLSQALKADAVLKQAHAHTRATPYTQTLAQQAVGKRRTSTPPLLPSVKVEPDGVSSSASSSLSSSSLLVGGVFPVADALAFPKEKSVYLSPKLKQLLQTQDSQKGSISHTLLSPLAPSSSSPLTASGRFKRRTSSPPNSPPLTSHSDSSESTPSFVLKVPKLEGGPSPSGAWGVGGREDIETKASHTRTLAQSQASRDWPLGQGGRSACNQQPLDLSSGAADPHLNSGGPEEGIRPLPVGGGGEAVLDLSVHCKSAAVESDTRGSTTPLPGPVARKKKPNTSMLEKVLMNNYAGLAPPPTTATSEDTDATPASSPASVAADAADITSSPPSPSSSSERLPAESSHSSPPSLTPVTLHPASPDSPHMASPTPPPPLLPTALGSSPPPPPPLAENPDTTDSSCPLLSPKSPPTRPEPMHRQQLDNAQTESPQNTGPTELSLTADSSEKPTLSPDPDTTLQKSVSPHPDRVTCNHAPPNGTLAHSQSPSEKSPNGSVSFEETVKQKLDESEDSQLLRQNQSPSQSHQLQTESPVKATSKPPPADTSQILKEVEHHQDMVENSAPREEALERSYEEAQTETQEETDGESFSKTFVCNVCELPFGSMGELSRHIVVHASDWPLKCEFCLQLYQDTAQLLEHRAALHAAGSIYACSACAKEFAFLCNLQQHQRDLHPDTQCSHTLLEHGRLRPHNYTDPSRAAAATNEGTLASGETTPPHTQPKQEKEPGAEEQAEEQQEATGEVVQGKEDPAEELYTTIKIMASEAGRPKGPDVRLGINQHYPSYKPPPFPYHNRSHAAGANNTNAAVASATNFTTHNIPQTFSTAIRCTKCGVSFDNMPELHKHILACASASDKRRYTPKKNPIPLRQTVRMHNGLGATTATGVAATASTGVAISPGNTGSTVRRVGHPKKLSFGGEPVVASRISALNKKKQQLLQKAISQKSRTNAATTTTAATTPVSATTKTEEVEEASIEVQVCPHCSREFTYPASLSKHISGNCPMKPAAKRGRKPLAAAPAAVTAASPDAPASQDKSMSLRRRPASEDLKQEVDVAPRPLGKTRARSSELAEAALPPSKGKAAIANAARSKRPAPQQPAAGAKKGRKSLQQTPPPTVVEAPERPAGTKGLKSPKEAAVKRSSEGKPPVQSKAAERFSLRTRERLGGPVTRSLQQASVPPESSAEEVTSQDARDAQEPVSKLAR